MIVVSLLLILVAVTLLVLGLAGGSSTLLISSIVASLLAAVALVVGARQAGASRRSVGEPLLTDDTRPATDPAYTEAPARAGAGRRGAASADRTSRSFPDDEPDPDRIIREAFAGASSETPASGTTADGGPADGDSIDRTGRIQPGDTASPSPPDAAASISRSTPTFPSDSEPDRAAAYAAGQRDTEAGLSGPSRAAGGPGPDVTQRVEPDTEPAAPPPPGGAATGADRAPYSGTDADRTTGRRAADPADAGDYDQAASMIGGARAAEDDSWRRAPAETAPDSADSWQRAGGDGRAAREESWQGAGGDAGAAREDEPWGRASDAGDLAEGEPSVPGARPLRAEGVAVAGAAEAGAGEFAEPDPDDPDDEPLPQRVRPADAVRVARMDAEVVVVDGRPRYHLAGCGHLSGRETEALPVAEAVELGFSPCGLCRPVDHLVAAGVR
ncbi:hypothetical protein [Actinoplanes sp. NPDC049681]|uniref:hypothetical protein n=1 Tax=Actinoplanes sp. NPDC049681 TaxID=3363905 RepID=UPI00379F2005